MRQNTCCFTGHRVLGTDFSREKLKAAIESLIDKGVTVFISGGALGFDTEAAIEVLRQRKAGANVSLHIYAPCLDQDKLWSFSQKKLYGKIIKNADCVDVPSYPYNNQCMKIRNYKMVDSSAYVIAYYNGEFKSGTGQTVRYAQKSGLEIINLSENISQ